jgi:hypothetical protein
MRQREGGRSALEPVVAVLPGDPVEDDRRKLVRRRGEWGFGDAAQDGAGREFHDVSFRLGMTPDREACKISFRQRHLPVERTQGSR